MALKWEAPFDPDEVKDYTRDWTAEMTARDDTISSVTFTLPQAAEDAGLNVQDSLKDTTNKKAIVWFISNDPEATLAALSGQRVAVNHTIVTTAGRTYNETIFLTVRAK